MSKKSTQYENQRIAFLAKDGVEVVGEIVTATNRGIEVAMLFPFDGFKHALYRNGPAVLAKPSILDRKEELAHRLLNELYEAVSEFDNRFYELAHAYIGLKQQNEALKSISDRDVRSRIARKLSDELFSRLSSPTSVLMRDQLLGALERFVQNGEKPLKAQLS